MKQMYNKKIGAWVKGKMTKTKNGGSLFKITNVKEKNPKQPFKGVKKA